jgi:hypothetical protein
VLRSMQFQLLTSYLDDTVPLLRDLVSQTRLRVPRSQEELPNRRFLP